jgi:uncharacterized protein YndB with AHSA1/START domain
MKKFQQELGFALERETIVRAPRSTVFRYFTDPARFARWWGQGSTIEGRAGGALRIVYPNGVVASGEVLELVPEERVVFSYGYESGAPIAPGTSRVSVSLADHALGTRLSLRHEFADGAVRDQHVQGWRHQLSVFANVAAEEAHAGAASLADRWFAAWNEDDARARRRAFDAFVESDVSFADAYGCLRGIEDLDAHVSACKVHMPRFALERAGEPRSCQGSALVDWTVKSSPGDPIGRGTSLFEFTPEGRISRVVGFWSRA